MAAKKINSVQIARRISLEIVLIGFTILTILHQKLQGIPSVDALDPFGGLETLMKFLAGGEFIKKIEPGNIVLFGAVVALGLVLSRVFLRMVLRLWGFARCIWLDWEKAL